MTAPRITTDKARELLAGATPGPWRGDRYDGTVKYHILAGAEGSEVAVLTVDHKNGTYGFGCGEECGYPTSPSGEADELLTLAAPDLAADLIDARAQIAALTAAQVVTVEAHARAVRHAHACGYFMGGHDQYAGTGSRRAGAWEDSDNRSSLLATLTPIVGADRALALVDGDADARGAR